MPNELQAIGETAQTHYFMVFDDQGNVFQTTTGTFVAYVTANIANYDIPATELGTASQIYQADFPNDQVEATYGVVFRQQSGGAPAENDIIVATGGIAISDECPLAVPIPEESSSSSSTSSINSSSSSTSSVNSSSSSTSSLSSSSSSSTSSVNSSSSSTST